MPKVSLVITVLNEEKTILQLLESIRFSSKEFDEIIIVDGGSSDKTIELIKKYKKKYPKLSIAHYSKKGNRSLCRNFAILTARNNWIAITDAGCVLDKNWLKELILEQQKAKTSVVAGYYRARATTPFERASATYALVMPNKLNKQKFLPATRSMLLNKNTWKVLGGFDESLSDNEDYAFARKILKNNIEIAFAKQAIVFWFPRTNLKSFLNMIFKFARGDIEALIIRPKVLLIFLRYLVAFILIIWAILNQFIINNFWFSFGLLVSFLLIYILWSIYKNYRYAKDGWYWLPVLQILSDLAVIWGSICGITRYKKR